MKGLQMQPLHLRNEAQSGSSAIGYPTALELAPTAKRFSPMAVTRHCQRRRRAVQNTYPLGGVGIGFFIWDSWNSSRISDIIVALLYVGLVGLLLDRAIALLGRIVTRGTAST